MQVKSRTIAMQLDGTFLGSIRPIDKVVIDKVGLYAYPLHDEAESSFFNALVVDVQARRRTKLITVRTPYKLMNQSALPLQFKVRHHMWPHNAASLPVHYICLYIKCAHVSRT